MQKTRWYKRINFSPFISLAIALVIGAILIWLTGNSPADIYKRLLEGALGGRSSILQTLLQATPLLFCGLAVLVSMRGGLLNLGVEGQLYMGALMSTLVAVYVKGLPAFIHIPLCMLAGMAGGALWAFLPVWLKIKRGIHEVVSALMLNYIATLLVDFMTNYPLRDPNSSVAQSYTIQESAMLPKLFPKTQVTGAIFIGVALVVILAVLFRYTRMGYEVTLIGKNPKAAAACGVEVSKMMLMTMMISGMCGGLAGTMEVLGTFNRLIQGFSPGYGFDGIAVAVLGGSPIAVVLSSLLFGILRAGGMALNFGTNLSVKFITTLQGIIILLISAPAMASNVKDWLQSKKKPRPEKE